MSLDFSKFPGKFTRLVLSGGGPKGLALLGGLHYVDEHGGLEDLQEYWVTSIGSVIGVLLVIGYTPFEIFHKFFMLENFADPTALDIQSILETSSLCPIEVFGDKIRMFIEYKLGKDEDPTFFDLYNRFGKKIHIMGTNTDTMRGECFDVDTKPLMKVIDAIEISCDLPYIFTKKKFEGYTYVDGGFINNYAINLADNKQDYVLGLFVYGDHDISGSDYIGWIYRLLFIPIMELHRERVSRLSEKCTHVELKINNISMIEMSPSRKKKIDVFSAGYQQTRTTLLEMQAEHVRSRDILSYKPLPSEKVGDGWDVEFGWSDDETP